jgi:hypothetical protein
MSRESCGQNWEGKLFYFPDANKRPESGIFEPLHAILENETLKIDFDEKVSCVYSYMGPLTYNLPPTLEIYHRYIVIKTTKYWWSIEKNTKGITLQRGLQEDDVVKQCRGEVRSETEEWLKNEKDTSSHATMGEFFKFLVNNKKNFNDYYWYGNNCKGFGEFVFEFFQKKTVKQ